MAALISQATKLGVVSMSASVQSLSVDMLRHVLQDFVREERKRAPPPVLRLAIGITPCL
jgi:hypothetical protein